MFTLESYFKEEPAMPAFAPVMEIDYNEIDYLDAAEQSFNDAMMAMEILEGTIDRTEELKLQLEAEGFTFSPLVATMAASTIYSASQGYLELDIDDVASTEALGEKIKNFSAKIGDMLRRAMAAVRKWFFITFDFSARRLVQAKALKSELKGKIGLATEIVSDAATAAFLYRDNGGKWYHHGVSDIKQATQACARYEYKGRYQGMKRALEVFAGKLATTKDDKPSDSKAVSTQVRGTSTAVEFANEIVKLYMPTYVTAKPMADGDKKGVFFSMLPLGNGERVIGYNTGFSVFTSPKMTTKYETSKQLFSGMSGGRLSIDMETLNACIDCSIAVFTKLSERADIFDLITAVENVVKYHEKGGNMDNSALSQLSQATRFGLNILKHEREYLVKVGQAGMQLVSKAI